MRSWTWVKKKEKNGNKEERRCDDRNVTETWSFAFRRGNSLFQAFGWWSVARRKRARKNLMVEKRERERARNACEICFQKVIPPTLSTSNPNVVSGVKSCQSSNGRQTALFTEFKKDMPVYILYICFLRTNKSLTSKNERTGKHYSFHFLCRWFSLNRSNILAAVGFC